MFIKMCSMFHLCVAVSVLYCLYKITGGKRALVNQLVIASCEPEATVSKMSRAVLTACLLYTLFSHGGGGG